MQKIQRATTLSAVAEKLSIQWKKNGVYDRYANLKTSFDDNQLDMLYLYILHIRVY